jgi:hypothetical protein
LIQGNVTTKSTDKMSELAKIIKSLSKLEVLVGIPEDKDARQEGDTIGNAELAYIHTHGIRQESMINAMQPELNKGTPYSKAHQMYIQSHGSPLYRSPARPIIEPAIEFESNKQAITKQLGIATKFALKGDKQGTENELNKAGLLAQNLVRDWLENPANGWEPNADSTIKAKGSSQPLIDKGELRKSISYVIKGES